MDAKIERLCASEVPGDTQRNLRVAPDYTGQTFKHLLVPVWVLSYNYGSKSFQVIINGYTGSIAGQHPLSWVKIALAVLAALIVVLIILSLASGQR
jgi:hypothetical protein